LFPALFSITASQFAVAWQAFRKFTTRNIVQVQSSLQATVVEDHRIASYREHYKQQIQFMLFPEGMSYNRKNDECRTPRINEVFLQIAEQAQELTQNKNGNNTFVLLPSSFVRGRRRKSNYYMQDFNLILSFLM
jgi:hypothetical protein